MHKPKNKFSLTTAVSLAVVLVASLFATPTTIYAATDPGLGAAGTFSIVAQTAITGTGTISGDVGINSTGAGITALTAGDVGGTIYSTDGVAPGLAILDPDVQANLSTANNNMSAQGSDGTIGPALDGLVVTTGVYDIGAGRLNGGVLTLDGPGTYIFRASSDFISSGSIDLTNGARACDVYWQVDTLATINGSEFTGTIVAGTGVHFGANVALDGRALALGGDVTLSDTTISDPACAEATGTISVVKVVVNDNGQSAVIADFPLFVNETPVTSGEVNVFAPDTYTVTETEDSTYSTAFTGDCSVDGVIELTAGMDAVCIITNDDILQSSGGSSFPPPIVPPLINIEKVPSPLSLPDGAGEVVYTYTLTNLGTVPVTNMALAGDTCSPISLISGDTDIDFELDVDETWIYTCTTTLTETHTNTIVATGWANGLSTVDIASATVIVGAPIVPPLIHVTKVPNLPTVPFGGGLVTYTETITNPGIVPLSNVQLVDDRCEPVTYISGDTNDDDLLDPTEAWVYSCQEYLTVTTTNTAAATGEANGITVRDFAIVTVVVATNTTPQTPLPVTGVDTATYLGMLGVLTLIRSFTRAVARKRES